MNRIRHQFGRRLGQRLAHFGGVSGLCLAVLGCSSSPQTHRIRHRDPARAELRADHYAEEFAYIGTRRRQLPAARPDGAGTVAGVPRNLVGLAYSGGGIRSATFNLGATEAMRRSGLFDQFDYVSAVSGGAYLAGWQQAHLGARNLLPLDRTGIEVGAESADALLAAHGDHVEHLRAHSGFLNQGGWFEAPMMFLDWLWRWPAHVILDDLVHLRGWFNFQHVVDIYRSRIETTYFRGRPRYDRAVPPKADLLLADVNAPGRERLTPYMIVNGNLTNRGNSRIGVRYDGVPECDRHEQWNFEFTRDFTGSDATGYIATRGFGLPVADVETDSQGHPIAAEVEVDSAFAEPFTLSRAVAASGAAFDSTFLGNWIDWWGVNEAIHFVGGGLLNLNLGVEVPNFARSCDTAGGTFDYLRMMTYQRNPRWTDPGARWLYITDGGHYENLGVLSLLRRGTQCVVAFDAGADPKREYSDLKTLKRRVEQELKLRWKTPLPTAGDQPRYRFEITDGANQTQAIVLYIKASADESFAHMSPTPPAIDFQARRAAVAQELRAFAGRVLTETDDAPPCDSAAAERLKVGQRIEDLSLEIERPMPEGSHLDDKLAAREVALQLAKEDIEQLAERSELITTAATGKELQSRFEEAVVELELERHSAKQRRLRATGTAAIDEKVAAVVEAVESARLACPATGLNPIQALAERAGERARRLRTTESEQAAHEVERAERIRKIRDFASQSWVFPHDSTVVQWYEWERFEAYRLLGYEMARTYLRPLSPPPGSDDTALSWCDFADSVVSPTAARE